MADITPITSTGGPGGVDPGKDARKSEKVNQGPSFAEILQKTSGPGAAAPSQQTPEAYAPTPAYLNPVVSAQESVARTGQEFLTRMDTIQHHLSDPRSTMRDIAPLMSDLERFRDHMIGEINALPKDDPGRGLLEEMAVLASSEVAKYNRGDYI